jgi:signal transduction histidine kinase
MRLGALVTSLAFRLAILSGVGLLVLAVIAALSLRELIHEERHSLTRSEVETAISLIANYDARSKNGEFSQEDAQGYAKQALNALRYGRENYFFVMNLDKKLIVHPVRPDLAEHNTGLESDKTGFDYPSSFLKQALNGGGHTHYFFPKPGMDEPVRKLSYSALYEPWGWVVSSGVYYDDIDATFQHVAGNFLAIAGIVFLSVSFVAYLAFRQLVAAIEGKRLAEQETLRASKLASIGQLAAGLAHEINTPVQYISDNLHYMGEEQAKLLGLLMEGKFLSTADARQLSDELPAAVSDSLDGVAHIAKIVDAMKAFSQVSSAATTLADINQTLENVLTVSESLWKPVMLVEKRFAPDLPMLACQLAEINQVFLHLLVNAAEAVRQSAQPLPGHLLLETCLDGGDIVVRFTDDGVGVPDELTERIFDPFFTTKTVGQGMGLGLAICRDVVEIKHGGRIDVAHAAGGGSTFTVHLPVKKNS